MVPGRTGERGTIVFVAHDFEPTVAGIARQTSNQARALARRGHDVAVVTRRLRASWPRRERLDGVEVVRLGVPGKGSVQDKVMVTVVAVWLWRARRSVRIVNVVGYADFAFSTYLAGLLGRTVVLWVSLGDARDDLGPSRKGLRRWQAEIRRRALRRCTNVGMTVPIVQELDGVGLGSRALEVPVPVDRTRFRPPTPGERATARRQIGLDRDQLAFVYIGHLRKLKGVDRLIDAFASLRGTHPRACLLLVGAARGASDDAELEWREQVEALGLSSSIIFTGNVADVRQPLWAADVFVLPSSREGLPNSLVEAMSCGLACIAPRSAAGLEVLSDQAGLVPASNDPEDLLPSLVEMADDGPLRSQLSAAALARVATFDLEAVTDTYEKLYQELDDALV
jgi:glycosyltransferase involved in cell wall biosynthesis